jgi:hypothetical protein
LIESAKDENTAHLYSVDFINARDCLMAAFPMSLDAAYDQMDAAELAVITHENDLYAIVESMQALSGFGWQPRKQSELKYGCSFNLDETP